MRRIKRRGKRVIAYLLVMCMMVMSLTGISIATSTTEVKAATGFTQYDFLKCDGTSIRNNYGKGNNVYLRGTNIGNLFVQESWMSSTNATDQKTILNALTSRFGQDRALELLDYYESNYFTEADFDRCQAMGMSVLRVPFTYMNLYKQSGNSWVLRDDAFDRLDWIVQECSERGMYVILDLHGAFGSQNGQDHSGEVINSASDVTFFSNETLMSQTLELWRVVAQHYAGNPAVAAYDTLNEPGEKAGTTSERHWNFYDRMYDTIRSVDPDHIIIMESCWGVSNLPNPNTYGWTNVVYEYHHYPWDYVADTDVNYTGQVNAINNLISSVNNANYGVPTFIGEFNCFDGDAKWQYVLNAMNDAGWHYTNWSYKSRGMGSWGIYHELGTEKVDPWNSSESDILRIWGSDSVGTNVNDTGVTYNNMRQYLPGTIVKADKALTDSDYVAIKANINNKYVCAEDYGESNLIADRDSAGGWEQFRIISNSDGTISLQSRANNKYLCAVFDDTDTENPVIARSNAIGTWEKFYLEKQNDGTYALRTYENNYYVQADINDTNSGILHAYGESVGTWEKFTLEAVSGSLTIPDSSTSNDSSSSSGSSSGSTASGNLALGKSVTQSSAEADGMSGKYAVDGDMGTRWASSWTDSEWICIDLGATYSVNQVVLNWEGAYGKAYNIQVSTDGSNWTTVSSLTNQDGGTDTISFNAVNARYVRMYGVERGLAYGYSLYEFEVYGGAATNDSTGGSTSGNTSSGNISSGNTSSGSSSSTTTTTTNTKYGNNFKAVAYYPNWYGDITSRVQWDKLTHAYYAFGLPDGNGTGVMESLSGQASNINAMVNACNNNDVIPVLSVGGWSYSDGSLCSEVFARNTETDAECYSLAQSIVSQAVQYGFKGVDIDWEYPNSSTQAQYTKFMKNLRTLCDQNGLILTVAVAATSGSGFTSEVLNLLDFVNIMAYDGDSGSGHSPYSLATNSFTYWRDTMGVPAEKLVIGVPFYERPNWASYADIVAANSANAYNDSAVINGTTVYYNGLNTMAQKATYAAQNAGGIMIWEISQDSQNSSLSLLNTIYNSVVAILGTTTETTVTSIPGTVKVDSYSGKSSGITISTENGVTYAGNLGDGSYLDYQINIPTAGTYTVTLKLAAGDSQWNAENMYVKVDDGTAATVAITGSSSWTTYVDHTASVYLSAGTHKLTLQTAGGACNVTDFTVTQVSNSGSSSGSTSGSTEATATGNIAKGATATASGAEADGVGAQYAIDGDEGTRWSSNFADDAWITVDLGSTYAVNKVVLKWEGAYGSAYKIQTSLDGSNWTTVSNLTGQDGGTDEISFNATNARYVRMQGVTRALPYGYSLWEMEVYATGSSSSSSSSSGTYGLLSLGKSVTASGAEADGVGAQNAVDGDTGTRWSSNFSDDAWITVDLGKTYSVDKVVLNWEGAYGSAYKIQTSLDGSNWTTVSNLTGQDGGTDTVTFNATNARYVRMQGVTRALPYGYSLWEMEVYGK